MAVATKRKAPTPQPRQAITVRIEAPDYKQLKAQYRRTYRAHGLSLNAYIVARLMGNPIEEA